MSELESKLVELVRLLKAVKPNEPDMFATQFEKAIDLGLAIRKLAMFSDVVVVGERPVGELELIQQVLLNKRSDKSLCSALCSEIANHQLEIHDAGKIAVDEIILTTMDLEQYVQGLFEIGVLVTDREVPTVIAGHVGEARDSFARGNYRAVCSLSRTLIELAARERCIEAGTIDERGRPTIEWPRRQPNGKKYVDLQDLIDVACGRDSNKRKFLHKIRERTNSIVHGSKDTSRANAKAILHDAIEATHYLLRISRN